jgi:GINS complex subunit 4
MISELDAILNPDVFTPSQKEQPTDFALLFKAWINELHAPELLQFQDSLISNVRELLEVQVWQSLNETNNIEIMLNSPGHNPAIQFILQQEVERIRFVIRSYLRTRISKVDGKLIQIEKYCVFLLSDPEQKIKLSNEEVDFATKFADLISDYHRTSFLNQLQQTYRSIADGDMSILLC